MHTLDMLFSWFSVFCAYRSLCNEFVCVCVCGTKKKLCNKYTLCSHVFIWVGESTLWIQFSCEPYRILGLIIIKSIKRKYCSTNCKLMDDNRDDDVIPAEMQVHFTQLHLFSPPPSRNFSHYTKFMRFWTKTDRNIR